MRESGLPSGIASPMPPEGSFESASSATPPRRSTGAYGVPQAGHNGLSSGDPSTPSSGVALQASSLHYANAAGRAGFDFSKFYNDFTNEGYAHPVHFGR